MVFTNRDDINEKVRKFRNHGSSKRDHHSYGFNSRLDDIQAGVLSAKIKHITEWTDRRIALAKRYDEGLAGVQAITLPYTKPGYRHVFHLYVVETKDPAKRDNLVQFLQDNDIDAKTHYSIVIHKQEGYPWGKDAEIVGSVEQAERNADSCVSLPMFPELQGDQVDYVAGKVLEWDKANS